MADEKIILTEIDIDVDASVANISELKTKVADLSKALGEMKKDGKDTSAEYIKLSTDLKVTTAELKSNETMLVKVAQSNKANTGSIEQLRINLALVSAEWAKETSILGENTDRAKQLSAQKLALSEALKVEEKATGDSRRAVGEYENAGKSLKAELKELTATLTAMKIRGEENSEQFKEMTRRGGQLVDALADVRAEMKLTGSDTKNIDIAVGSFMALGSAVQVSEGAMQLFGAENEEVQKGIQKMVAIQGILNGVQEIGNALQKESAFMMGINAVKTKVMGAAQAFYTAAIGTSTGALKAFKIALISTGIGAIVIAIGLLVANWDKLSAAMGSSAKEAKKINDELERTKELSQDQIRFDNLKLRIKKELGATEKEITEEEIKQNLKRQAEIDNEIYKLNQLKAVKDLEDDQAKTLSENYVKYQNLKDEAIILNLKLEKEAHEEIVKKEEEAEKARQVIMEGRVKAYEAEQKAKEDQVKLAEEEADRLAEIAEANVKAMMDAVEATRAANEQMAEEKKAADQAEIDRKIEVAALNYENELAAADELIFGKLEVEKAGLEMKRKQELAYATKIGADTVNIEKKYSNAKKAIFRAEQSAKLSLASDFAQNIATIAGEQSAIGKAAAAAATTISTFQGATAAFTGMVTAIPGPVGIGLGIAAAAAAVASGIANVKKIYATKTGLPGDGGGGGGSSTPSVPATTAPDAIVRESVNPEIGAGIVSRSAGVTENGGIVLQPTLVEDEVTNKQKNSSSIQTTSVL